ncbi:ferritin-like domain-containing protein [Cytobacillus sp. S13-E01]|uniref:ferritin-like domain-containing protein n=1 Tax=Cytobacillus sp. S13-E01 TaxID=3031326 RepID=UPI0023D89FE8|nr:ferritin-like domain-containing protein [Cytobacillus sp. S13-E01]MDF0728149.1 ferritin-like domain-containing protein [Cytobacillus sp. S13-E01]
MNHYNYYHAMHRPSDKQIKKIEAAINGEYSAIQCYANLARSAPTAQERKRIHEIRKDEMNHFNAFVQIYVKLTGSQPQYKITEECPENYIDGLEFSLKNEQNTVDFYLDIADEASDQFIKEVFRRAAIDEQNHAVWFLYFFTKNR